jgi:hypothetical protein
MMRPSFAFSIEYNMICHKAQMSELAPEFKIKNTSLGDA